MRLEKNLAKERLKKDKSERNLNLWYYRTDCRILKQAKTMIKKNLKKIIERNPRIWSIAWKIIQSTNIFLPHDNSYRALQYLLKDKNALIIDVGANQGISSLGFRKLCPEAKIIGFEPNVALTINLEEIAKKIENFEYHMSGLGDKSGSFILFVPRYRDLYIHTFSSLDKDSLELAIANTYSVDIQTKISIESFECNIKTLDSYKLDPSVIKIDAEGFESNIIDGAEETINNSRPSIIFEAVHGKKEALINKLEKKNYIILKYDHRNNNFIKFDGVNPSLGSESRNLIAVTNEVFSNLNVA